MEDERIVISSSAAISPEAVAGKGFTTVLRGYQPAEVRQFLKRVADEVAAAAAREGELRRALHDAQNRAAHPELDEAALTSSLGEHAGRLIASARETAAAITAEAERTAAATLRDAEYRIARIRQEADTLMARRVDEADGVSASLRQSAEADARAVRDQAQAEAEAAIQAARSHGKEMVAEARAVRERMLGDLARRRRVAEVQLEQLRVARERLVQAYDVVRHTLEEATAELAAAEPEARLAAEAVGRRMSDADAHPPLRMASSAGGTGSPPPPPLSSPASVAPIRRTDASGRPMEPGRPAASNFGPGPLPSAYAPSSQPTHPAPPPMSAPAAPVSERPPHASGWIERAASAAGGGAPAGRPSPPPITGPVLVPAAGIGGGAPATDPVFDPADPGTWAGAGFGVPRVKSASPRPPEPGPTSTSSTEAHRTLPAPAPSAGSPATPVPGGNPSSPSSATSGGSAGPGGSASSGVASSSGPAPVPVSTRPPLRPQTVADSVPFRSRPATPAPPTGPSAGGAAASLGSTSPAPSAPAPGSGGSAVDTAPAVAPTTPVSSAPAPAPGSGASTVGGPGSVPSSGPSRTLTDLRPIPPDLPLEVPVASPEQPPELATAEQPAVRNPAGNAAPVDDLFARLRHQVPEAEPKAVTAEPPQPTPPSDDVVEEAALARRDQDLDPLDADLTRALKRILQDEQNDVLERLREGGRAGASLVLGALDQQTSSFTSAAAPALAAAYRAGGGEAVDTTGFALGGKLANDLATPLRERLERVLSTAGDDLDELSEAVRAAYRHSKLQEIEQLVRHHTAAAHALGAYASTTDGTMLRWVVDDEGPCPDCHDNTLAGPTPKGEPYPTGQDHPPAHLGCRCLLVAVTGTAVST